MQENNTDTTPAAEQPAGILARILTGWGLPGSLARILAGAILGALSALWAVSQTGCLAEWTQGADGSSSWTGRVELPPAQQVAPYLK